MTPRSSHALRASRGRADARNTRLPAPTPVPQVGDTLISGLPVRSPRGQAKHEVIKGRSELRFDGDGTELPLVTVLRTPEAIYHLRPGEWSGPSAQLTVMRRAAVFLHALEAPRDIEELLSTELGLHWRVTEGHGSTLRIHLMDEEHSEIVLCPQTRSCADISGRLGAYATNRDLMVLAALLCGASAFEIEGEPLAPGSFGLQVDHHATRDYAAERQEDPEMPGNLTFLKLS